MKKVFVLGSLNMDLVITAPREPAAGETIHGGGFMTNPGGKGANQAVACGTLGADVRMGGCIGNDAFGRALLDNLSRAGVDVTAVRAVADAPTGVAVITVVDSDNRIILDSGANACVTEADVDALLAGGGAGDLFLAQLENPADVVGYALRAAKERGMVTVLNPAPMNEDVLPFLTYCDFIMPNEREFYDLTGVDDLSFGFAALHFAGVSGVVVTLGDKGYCCSQDGNLLHGPCLPVTAVDTTAAGDTFCGAFVTRLSLGDDVAQALAYANRAAAITVTRRGAQCAIPTADEVAAFAD